MQDNMLSVPEGAGASLPDYVRSGIEHTKVGIAQQIDQILGSRDEKTEKKFDAFSEYISEKARQLREYTEAAKSKQ
jgi:hypothetical protein